MRFQSLQQLALSVRQRIDIGGQQNAFGGNSAENVTDLEMTTMLNASLARVWKAMVRKGPENYAWGDGGTGTRAGYIFPTVQGQYRYNLPFDFLKEKGVDLALDNSGQNWATMRPYTERDRNLFSFPLQTALAYAGWQNMRWQIQGDSINILPQVGPLPATIRLLYAPAAPILCPTMPAAYLAATAYAQDALVYANIGQNGEPPTFQVFSALNAGTSGTPGVGIGAIGAGTSAVTYKSLLANTTVLVIQTTGGTPGVVVSGSVASFLYTITVTTGSDTSNQVATLVNADPIASTIVHATGGGAGAASNGSAGINPWFVPTSAQPQSVVLDNGISWAYQGPYSMFANGFNGVNGWEDLIVLDTAIKCGIKQESDVSAMMAEKAEWKVELEEDLADRNQGDPMVLSGGFGMCEGGPAYGNGFGPFGGGGW